MTVTSPAFLVLAFLAVAAVHLLSARLPRDGLLLVFSLVFVTLALDLISLAGLALFVAGGFGACRLVGVRRRPGWALLAVASTVLLFWLLGEDDVAVLAGYQPEPVVLLGLSYVMFRIIHLLVDLGEGELEGTVRLKDYLGYLLFFPNFLAGPIQRYEHLAPQLAAAPPPPTLQGFREGLGRMLGGYFGAIVISGLALSAFEQCRSAMVAEEGARAAGGIAFAGACLAFTVHLYAAFAGYMGVIIGLGRLLGIAIPENFNRPERARNFLEFWSRWHITLSDWFKFYVFNPVTKELLRIADRPDLTPWLGAVGFFLTFFVMGIWHGTSATFAVYGLVLGLGVSLNKAWQTGMTQYLGRRGYTAISDVAWYRVAARTLALAYFALALVLLWADLDAVAALARSLGPAGTFLAIGAVVAAVAVCAVAWEVVRPPAGAPPDRPRVAKGWIMVAQGAAIAYYLAVWQGPVPELIYQRF